MAVRSERGATKLKEKAKPPVVARLPDL